MFPQAFPVLHVLDCTEEGDALLHAKDSQVEVTIQITTKNTQLLARLQSAGAVYLAMTIRPAHYDSADPADIMVPCEDQAADQHDHSDARVDQTGSAPTLDAGAAGQHRPVDAPVGRRVRRRPNPDDPSQWGDDDADSSWANVG